MSLFSNQLPNNEGVKNLVGYLFHKHQGLIVHSFPGANNHLYRFGGRIMLQEHLGLSSEIAAACAIIITQETGMNPESLYNLKLNNAKNIISPHESLDGYYLNYQKPRAGGEISRLIKRNKESINTEFCIRLVIELTEHHRSLANPETAGHLFIHDTVKEHKSITPVSVFAFKAALKRLIEKSFDIELIGTQVTLSKLRVSGGIIAWFESGGDPRAAARYLGNSIGVALKNYIPRELQEFFYRKQIRQFQHLLIAVATDNKPYQNIALEIKSSDTLNKYLENNVSNSKLLKSIRSENQNCATKVTFFISENNIALLQTVKNEFVKSNKKRKHHFKKWNDVATILFAYIRHQGTRRQQQIMKNGIDLSLNNPIILEDE